MLFKSFFTTFILGAAAVSALPSPEAPQGMVKRTRVELQRRAPATANEKRLLGLENLLGGLLGGGGGSGGSVPATSDILDSLTGVLPLPDELTSTVGQVTSVLDGLLAGGGAGDLPIGDIQDTLDGLTGQIGQLSQLTDLIQGLLDQAGGATGGSLPGLPTDLGDLPNVVTGLLETLLGLVSQVLEGLLGSLGGGLTLPAVTGK
ncbi:hypothetical protein JCM8547_007646 [Rhodosporidiobolus lusitaniae]